MKILQVHNEYVFPGGEDAVVSAEADLLRSCGHTVIEYRRSNKELGDYSLAEKIRFYANGIFYSRRVYDEVRALVERDRPDVAHFHNTSFMIGPAAYEACFDAGIPVVQTLHNYRFLCIAATFFRDGKICEDCLSRGRSAGVVHGCWHGALSSWMMTRVVEEYKQRLVLDRVKKFIALSEFSKSKFVQAGWDGIRITVKPNFLAMDPGPTQFRGQYVLYVGTLQPYKGLRTLLKAWASRHWPVPLKIVGSGPMEKELRAMGVNGVEWLGQKSSAEVIALMKDAAAVVIPSECYENFPMALVEAYACGVPVIASRLGALEELVEDGETGRAFPPGDSGTLAKVLSEFLENSVQTVKLAQQARNVFLERYTPSGSVAALTDIYCEVIHG